MYIIINAPKIFRYINIHVNIYPKKEEVFGRDLLAASVNSNDVAVFLLFRTVEASHKRGENFELRASSILEIPKIQNWLKGKPKN